MPALPDVSRSRSNLSAAMSASDTGDYSRGASGFWIEHGKPTFAVSEVTIAGHLTEIFRSLVPANNLKFRYGTDAPTVRMEGLTVAGH